LINKGLTIRNASNYHYAFGATVQIFYKQGHRSKIVRCRNTITYYAWRLFQV